MCDNEGGEEMKDDKKLSGKLSMELTNKILTLKYMRKEHEVLDKKLEKGR